MVKWELSSNYQIIKTNQQFHRQIYFLKSLSITPFNPFSNFKLRNSSLPLKINQFVFVFENKRESFRDRVETATMLPLDLLIGNSR